MSSTEVLIQKYQTLIKRRESVGSKRTATLALKEQNTRRIDAIKKELSDLGVDPEKVGEYLEEEGARLSVQLATFAEGLERTENSVNSVASSLKEMD